MNRWALVNQAEAYLESLQGKQWEVYRNGPGAVRVRVHRAESEAEAREFVGHLRRAQAAMLGANLSFWRTPEPGTLYTVEPRCEAEEESSL